MDLKLCLLVIIFQFSSQAKLPENQVSKKSDEPLVNTVFSDDSDGDEDDEDFLDIDEDLDYFYTYEAIKRLENLTARKNDSNTTIDLAEQFFLNFQTEYDDYSYEDYDDYDKSTERTQTPADTDYIELDEIEHDDFVYFTLDSMEDTVGQSSGGKTHRDMILMIVLLVLLMLGSFFLVAICLRKSRGQDGELSVRTEQEEEDVKKNSLLAEPVWGSHAVVVRNSKTENYIK